MTPTEIAALKELAEKARYCVPQLDKTHAGTILRLLSSHTALQEANREMVAHLRRAVEIIREHVPFDALGMNSQGGGDGWNDQSWLILDEYLHYADEFIAKHAAGDGVATPPTGE